MLFRVFFFLYLVVIPLVAFTGFHDPPGQTGCDVTWCGMVGFLSVFATGLPWSFLLLAASDHLGLGDVGFYWVCWGCIAFNLFLLWILSRGKRRVSV
jgi:hypothetical protein